ncbi:hypothetical protein Francci3_2440 [Frankia casuarinae]|uniref:Uncharacterized protein n=1 Tax=Frankia casuarinae (strain DSM 45818 / CECT 9043 / HFP020203 / CcI3) TaxID=106370 RepID=Q2JA85_FRACC|nr:hypothetical protein Francci3_2440 [Frankia casuarinae]
MRAPGAAADATGRAGAAVRRSAWADGVFRLGVYGSGVFLSGGLVGWSRSAGWRISMSPGFQVNRSGRTVCESGWSRSGRSGLSDDDIDLYLPIGVDLRVGDYLEDGIAREEDLVFFGMPGFEGRGCWWDEGQHLRPSRDCDLQCGGVVAAAEAGRNVVTDSGGNEAVVTEDETVRWRLTCDVCDRSDAADDGDGLVERHNLFECVVKVGHDARRVCAGLASVTQHVVSIHGWRLYSSSPVLMLV